MKKFSPTFMVFDPQHEDSGRAHVIQICGTPTTFPGCKPLPPVRYECEDPRI